MRAHENYVWLDLDLHKCKGHKESANDWFLINTHSLKFPAKNSRRSKRCKSFYVRALNSQKIYIKIKPEHCKFQPAMTLRTLVRLKKIQNVLESEWWDLSTYEISCVLLTVRYTVLDRLTWNDPAGILACLQVWSDFSHPQCINWCFCLSLAFHQWLAVAFRLLAFSIRFIVFSMFFYAFCDPSLCCIVLLPFLAILTDLILLLMYPTHIGLLFTVKLFYNLSTPLLIQLHLVVLCALWNMHAKNSIMVCG